MRILITGGAGYIGSHCERLLRSQGIETLVFDNFERGHRASLQGPFIVGDLLHPPDLDFAFHSGPFDAVMHFAALVIVEESVTDPARYLQVNTVGTLNLLEAMKRSGCSRLVFSSTAAVYGMPEQNPISEDHPLRPINPYGLSKVLAEQAIAYYGRQHGLQWVAFRYFNAAGREFPYPEARFREHDTHLITRVLNAGDSGKPLQIFGNDYETADGTCIRDYVHVSDIAGAHVLALDYLKRGGASGAFNIGNGAGYSVKEVLEASAKVVGHEIPAQHAPRRPGDPAALVASSEKLRREMGWNPRYNELSPIIASAWSWHHEDQQLQAAAAKESH
jgi:UDP-glucose 4-epimerase